MWIANEARVAAGRIRVIVQKYCMGVLQVIEANRTHEIIIDLK